MEEANVKNVFRRGDTILVDVADGAEQISLSLKALNELEDLDLRSTAAQL